MEWFLGFLIFFIYIGLLLTVCSMTFRKGYTWLGVIGIILPILWIIGAFLPPKPGSRQHITQETLAAQRIRDYSA
jgi:hypothetical protein